MADRRRVNGPSGTSLPPTFEDDAPNTHASLARVRERPASHIRASYLKTAVTPSASGSAYLELEPVIGLLGSGGLKLTCTVHGPRALPRSAPFSPHLVLSTHVKYAPFATRQRRGYLRDSSEKDLSTHLETALRGALIAERWPKSGVDVVVTIIEGEQVRRGGSKPDCEDWETLNVLGGCVTVASAALADAGIDCVDTVAGGVAALVPSPSGRPTVVLDPISSEHREIIAACCVAYLPNRDEITNLWLKGDLASMPSKSEAPDLYRQLVSQAVHASKAMNQGAISVLE